MAHLLAKFGEAAIKWHRSSNGSWRKPMISAKNLARLRRETLFEGGEWPYDKSPTEVKRRKPKGHKHDREKPMREAAIQQKLETMDTRIAEYREKRRAPMQEASLMDRLLLRPKEIRAKAKTG